MTFRDSEVKEEVQQLKLRLPRADYEALRLIAFSTGTSMNELVQSAIREYLTSAGRREHIRSLMEEAIEQYQVALDKLADT